MNGAAPPVPAPPVPADKWAAAYTIEGEIVEIVEIAPDAEDMHVYAHEFDPIGGFVCSVCGMPTESEPCPEHQPAAYSRMT